MKLRRPSPIALFPPTIEGLFALEAGLTISPNSLKTWWPGTELNRRRQPFQGCALPPELPGHFVGHPRKRYSHELSLTRSLDDGTSVNAETFCRERVERPRL